MRVVLGATALVVFGLAIFEVTMHPAGSDRLELTAIFIGMATMMIVAAWLLPRLVRLAGSVRWALSLVMILAFSVVTVGVAAAAQRMFISKHDLTFLLVVLAFGLVAASGFAMVVSRPLGDDLSAIAEAADRIGEGVLDVELDVDRGDEVGKVALAVERMVADLRAMELQRTADTEARRLFFTAVGHDLRTPLASIQAVVEALQDGLVDDPTRYLTAVERDVEALSNLVDDIFLLARIESGGLAIESAVVDLAELADEAIDVVAPIAAERGITIEMDATRSVMAFCGPEAISRVIRNLLDNAVRHSPPDSTVRVTLTAEGRPTVTVVDQGSGFTPEFADLAFDQFSRDDPSRARADGGAGLGLAIARGFVTALGGDIWAEPGPGGKVGFRLPSSV